MTSSTYNLLLVENNDFHILSGILRNKCLAFLSQRATGICGRDRWRENDLLRRQQTDAILEASMSIMNNF